VPIYAGGHNAAALRRAARNEGWIGVHHDFNETTQLIAQLRAVQAEMGRPHCAVMMNILRAKPDEVARFGELGVDALVLPALGLPGATDREGRIDAVRRAGEMLQLQPFAAA
jgi:alkanesulfonate monooxygenase SsuD/methylene tetrahydromethanopterin reductase-like flavin-dependent oxidoreductase (luciferase family)